MIDVSRNIQLCTKIQIRSLKEKKSYIYEPASYA